MGGQVLDQSSFAVDLNAALGTRSFAYARVAFRYACLVNDHIGRPNWTTEIHQIKYDKLTKIGKNDRLAKLIGYFSLASMLLLLVVVVVEAATTTGGGSGGASAAVVDTLAIGETNETGAALLQMAELIGGSE